MDHPESAACFFVLRCIDILSNEKRTTTWPHKAHPRALAAARAHAATDADQVCIILNSVDKHFKLDHTENAACFLFADVWIYYQMESGKLLGHTKRIAGRSLPRAHMLLLKLIMSGRESQERLGTA